MTKHESSYKKRRYVTGAIEITMATLFLVIAINTQIELKYWTLFCFMFGQSIATFTSMKIIARDRVTESFHEEKTIWDYYIKKRNYYITTALIGVLIYILAINNTYFQGFQLLLIFLFGQLTGMHIDYLTSNLNRVFNFNR